MKPHYYVYRVGQKGPTIKHATLLSAATEAERLSNQHPGETFEILQCVGVTRTTIAQTSWMDGVTPPVSDDTIYGWIAHNPGEPMPCDANLTVEVRCQDGYETSDVAAKFTTGSNWWTGQDTDPQDQIIAWRPAR